MRPSANGRSDCERPSLLASMPSSRLNGRPEPAMKMGEKTQSPKTFSANESPSQRALEDAAEDRAVALVEGRDCAVEPQVQRVLRRPVAVEVRHLVDGLREGVVRVEAEAVGEAALHRDGGRVVERVGRRLVDVVLEAERVAEVGARAEAGGGRGRQRRREADEAGDAEGRVDAGLLELVDVAVARQVEPAREEVTGLQRDAAPHVLLDARARLIGRRRLVVVARRGSGLRAARPAAA